MGVMEIVVTSKFTGRKFGHCLGLSCPVLGCVLVQGCGGKKKRMLKISQGPNVLTKDLPLPHTSKSLSPKLEPKR